MIANNNTGHRELEALIRQVPGVRTLYPADPLVKTVANRILSAAVPAIPVRSPITITDTEAGPRVVVHVGLTMSAPATATARAVYAAADEYFRAGGEIGASITIKVGSIG